MEEAVQPLFKPGENIALKVQPHQYEATVVFYRDVLRVEPMVLPAEDGYESTPFRFGDKLLWIDKVETLSQAEIWLEIVTDDLDKASQYFAEQQIIRADRIERLAPGLRAFWISSPSTIIHLVSEET